MIQKITKTTQPHDSVFVPGEAYTLAEFRRRAKCSRPTFAKWRRLGLEVVKIGSTISVLADDYIEFLKKEKQRQKQQSELQSVTENSTDP